MFCAVNAKQYNNAKPPTRCESLDPESFTLAGSGDGAFGRSAEHSAPHSRSAIRQRLRASFSRACRTYGGMRQNAFLNSVLPAELAVKPVNRYDKLTVSLLGFASISKYASDELTGTVKFTLVTFLYVLPSATEGYSAMRAEMLLFLQYVTGL